jgi:hypothetical protein
MGEVKTPEGQGRTPKRNGDDKERLEQTRTGNPTFGLLPEIFKIVEELDGDKERKKRDGSQQGGTREKSVNFGVDRANLVEDFRGLSFR